jgi:hypothetical protein
MQPALFVLVPFFGCIGSTFRRTFCLSQLGTSNCMNKLQPPNKGDLLHEPQLPICLSTATIQQVSIQQFFPQLLHRQIIAFIRQLSSSCTQIPYGHAAHSAQNPI